MSEPLIRIPKRLAGCLRKDRPLEASVNKALAQFEPWIEESRVPFFPEYTDHGVKHISGVLATAESLITKESWSVFTPADAAVLVLSILLHDCAMHLTEEAFVALVTQDRRHACTPGMGDRDWHVVWEEFLSDASRFDGRKLMRLFGDTKAVAPPKMGLAMDLRDRLLIGEFLRIHHPRLAQEIAHHGVPTSKGKSLSINQYFDDDEDIIRLAGLVARSHGVSVRGCIPKIGNKVAQRECKGVHAVFLMALIRVADYIQLDAKRAPKHILQITSLNSPISRAEWEAHHGIKQISHGVADDPDALYIEAHPTKAATFLRIQEWLRGCQKELDASWAVLGEVYGRIDKLDRLGLTLRRIRSNLDDIEKFGEEVSFIPRQASFDTAGGDLLKLLIKPLYGDHPGVGIRELMQNAVDAVRELEQYLEDSPGRAVPERPEQEADVLISVTAEEGKEASVTISDKGIGMTPEVIIKYFLTGGASLRTSSEWRRTFENPGGKSKVLRAGRFGVGALAAFLLGDRISVTTRHIDEKYGVAFEAGLDDDLIELTKCERPVGTTITIPISGALAEALRATEDAIVVFDNVSFMWDWYCLEQPSVKRQFNSVEYDQTFIITGDSDDWHTVEHPDFLSILWNYDIVWPDLICNGINIKDFTFLEPGPSWNQSFGLERPKVWVLDPNGHLPLNLQRSNLAADRYPFQKELHESIVRDLISFALAKGPGHMPRNLRDVVSLVELIYPGTSRRPRASGYATDWMYSEKGYGYLDAHAIYKLRPRSVIILGRTDGSQDKIALPPLNGSVVLPDDIISMEKRTKRNTEMKAINAVRSAFSGEKKEAHVVDTSLLTVVSQLKRKGARFLFSENHFQTMWNSQELPEEVRAAIKIEAKFPIKHPKYCLFSIGICDDVSFDFAAFIQENDSHLSVKEMVAEYYIDYTEEPRESPTGKAWNDILGGQLIPFDLEERKRKFAHLEKELEPYMAQWRG